MHFKTLLIVVAIVLFTSISYLLTAQTVIPTNYYGITAQDVTASIPANSTTLLKINAEGAIVKTNTYTQTNALNDEPPNLNQVARTKKVFAHYLPWYNAADGNRTGWCYEGDCSDLTNIHYSNQPRIGEYSQRNSNVLEYHILTAYMAGIDGFILSLIHI